MITKSKLNKIAQLAIIEFAIVILIFSGLIFYYNSQTNYSINTYNYENLNSYLSSISKNQQLREKVILEDLSSLGLSQDWSTVTNLIDLDLKNYELIISNSSAQKKIVECAGKNGKFFTKSFVSLYNQSVSDSKILILGVCY